MYIIIGALIIFLLLLYIMNSNQSDDKSAYIESTTHSYVDKDKQNLKNQIWQNRLIKRKERKIIKLYM